MDISEWSAFAQILIAILTLIGILVSLYMSTKALKEIKRDRELRQAPFLAFETGGFRIPVEFVNAGKRIPGFDPAFVEKAFSEFPEDAESVRVKHKDMEDGSVHFVHYGKLTNYGLGPALNTIIYWLPEEIKIGSDKFKIDEKKLREPKYSKGLNRLYPSTINIKPGQVTNLIWLPVFIEKDFEKKISEARGVLEIYCQDVFHKKYFWEQSFFIVTGYDKDNPYVHVTFGDKKII
jgi:hypothetical protein